MKKYFCLLFAFFALLASVDDAPTVYSTIQPLNLSSLEWIDDDWPNESFHEYLLRCLDYQTNPQPAKKRRIVFKLFHKRASLKPQKNHNVLSDLTTAQDLNLFCGQKIGDPYLAEIICRAKTELGKVFLYGLIGTPNHDIELLEKRQAIIKTIVSSQEFFTQASALYDQFASIENILLSFWAQDGFLHSTKRHYFSIPYFESMNERLNKSETALAMRSAVNHSRRAFYLAGGLFAGALLPIYGFYVMRNAQLPSPFDRIARHLQGSGGRLLGLLSCTENAAVAGTATIAAGIYCALACKEDYDWAADNVTLDTCVQKKMCAIAQFFDALTKLKKTLDAFAFENMPAAQKIAEFFEDTIKNDPELLQLVDLTRTSTFQGEPSFFKNQGRILLAFRLMYAVKEKIEPVLMALAELDAYLSVAALFNDYKNERVHFCFVTYEKNPTASVSMQQFWNPFIDSKKVVANDLTLQAPKGRNMVITGPNAGGKSTLIKAIALNLILAQSLCIAAADSLTLTPFYTIGTYLNVVDNIAVGNSLFKAQVLRAQQMVDLVEKTPKDAFSFIALDEMFNGTSAKESKVIAYSVAKHISHYENNICLLATHFPLLTKLADEHTAFANYKVSVDVDQSRGIHYPFKLEKGLSNQHIALDILREEGYACSIVEDALSMLHHKIDQ